MKQVSNGQGVARLASSLCAVRPLRVIAIMPLAKQWAHSSIYSRAKVTSEAAPKTLHHAHIGARSKPFLCAQEATEPWRAQQMTSGHPPMARAKGRACVSLATGREWLQSKRAPLQVCPLQGFDSGLHLKRNFRLGSRNRNEMRQKGLAFNIMGGAELLPRHCLTQRVPEIHHLPVTPLLPKALQHFPSKSTAK